MYRAKSRSVISDIGLYENQANAYHETRHNELIMTIDLNKNELKILTALRSSPELKNCFLEMVEITQVPLGTLDNGDDAETAVVEAIQKTGTLLLEQWAQKKSDEATDKIRKDEAYRPQGKKK